MLEALLSSGLPISYVMDTGGRGPHIGIVLKDAVSKSEFDSLVTKVMQRLPAWIDSGVGKINQLERVPNTTRINKRDETVTVKLIYTGNRTDNAALKQWIDLNPIINPLARPRDSRSSYEPEEFQTSTDEAEAAAFRFVNERGLQHSKIRAGKMSVSCPKADNHKNGRDRTM